MKCPYCLKDLTEVTNSRPTHQSSSIWRRRRCINCEESFTTHEIIDLSHLNVLKKSGRVERFEFIKLYSGIYGASIGFRAHQREKMVDKITREIEMDLLHLRKKVIPSTEIADLVLKKLRRSHIATFMRFLAFNKDLKTEVQTKRELEKYLS